MTLNPIALIMKFRGSSSKDRAPESPSSPSTKVRLFAILPVLVMITAFTLSFLCVYAGHTPGMMEDYAIFTLNTSRIGQNIKQDLDNKIMGFDFNFKRSAPVRAALPTITPAPTTLITLAPRGNILSSLTANAGSDINSAESHIHSKAESLESEAHSKANSIESAAESKITEAVGSIQTEVVHLVNKAFNEIIDELSLHDFYSVHVMTTCEGVYVSDSANITVGKSPLPTPGETRKLVDSCSSHSAIDPLSFLNVFYFVGVVLTGLAMVTCFLGAWKATWKMALFNVLATVPAFCMMGLSSALAHGVAVGVPKLIDFVGNGIGIDAVSGSKFLTLTWAVVILLFVNMVCWSLIIWISRRGIKAAGASEKDALPLSSVGYAPRY